MSCSEEKRVIQIFKTNVEFKKEEILTMRNPGVQLCRVAYTIVIYCGVELFRVVLAKLNIYIYIYCGYIINVWLFDSIELFNAKLEYTQ